MPPHVDIAHEVKLIPDFGVSADLRSIQPFVDRLGAGEEEEVEMGIERDGVVRAMDERDPAGLEAVVHIVDGQQRLAHWLQGGDCEGYIEPAREIKLFAFRTNEFQFDRIASTEFKDADLQVGEEVELLSQRFNGCEVQALARQI